MNRKLLITALLAMTASTLPAQRLFLEKQTVDVGRTEFQLPVTATFELRNKSLRKLVITDVVPDCNCTKVEFPRGEIGAGDKFTIRMTYDARMLGHFYKQAAIVSNGSSKPVYITMTGVVLADLQDYSGSYPYDFNGLLADRNELEFDNVNKGDHPVCVMRIMNNGTTVMQPHVLHLPTYLQAEVQPSRLTPGHSGKVVFTLDSEHIHSYGLSQSNVYLAQKVGEQVSSATEMGVSVVLLPDLKHFRQGLQPSLEISDSVLHIAFEGKNKKTAEIELSNRGQAPLNISSLQLFTRGLKVTLGKRVLAPGESTKMKVTAIADQLAKVRTRPRVLMITNDPRLPKIVININVQ